MQVPVKILAIASFTQLYACFTHVLRMFYATYPLKWLFFLSKEVYILILIILFDSGISLASVKYSSMCSGCRLANYARVIPDSLPNASINSRVRCDLSLRASPR